MSNGDFGAALGNYAEAEAGVFTTVPSQNDVALVFDPSGTLGSTAQAGDGNLDLASVFGDNSTALAGEPGNFDLASAFGDGLNATATGGNFVTDILPSLGEGVSGRPRPEAATSWPTCCHCSEVTVLPGQRSSCRDSGRLPTVAIGAG